jgi:hypothetical protein
MMLCIYQLCPHSERQKNICSNFNSLKHFHQRNRFTKCDTSFNKVKTSKSWIECNSPNKETNLGCEYFHIIQSLCPIIIGQCREQSCWWCSLSYTRIGSCGHFSIIGPLHLKTVVFFFHPKYIMHTSYLLYWWSCSFQLANQQTHVDYLVHNPH